MSRPTNVSEPATRTPRSTIVAPVDSTLLRRRRFAAALAASTDPSDPLEVQDQVTRVLCDFLAADRALLWRLADGGFPKEGLRVASESTSHEFVGMSMLPLVLPQEECERLMGTAIRSTSAVFPSVRSLGVSQVASTFLAIALVGPAKRSWIFVLERLGKSWSEPERALLDELSDLLLLAVERNFAAANLLERSDQLDNVLRFSDLGILLIENAPANPVITIANQRFCEFFNLDPDSILHQSWADSMEMLAPLLADSDNPLARLEQILADTEADLVDEMIFPNAAQRVLNRYSTPALDASGRVFGRIFFFRDITYDKELEKQLLHSQKMESIGTLAGGVAHDFNNLLTSMLGYAELLKKGLADQPVHLARLENIERGAKRAAELTGNLLAFSRRGPTLLKVFDLNRLAEETNSLIRSSIPHSVTLILKLSPKPLTVEADETQIQQVIMNLMINARDAVEADQGTIVLSTRTGFDTHLGEESPEFVVLEVDDDGMGIPTDSLHRVFEPFYTTKDVGKGTGLGLSMVYGIVKKHHGFIEVHSAPGLGSRFSIYLPPSNKQPEPGSVVNVSNAPPDSTDLTILIVDDEEDLRDFCQLALTDYFSEVLIASDGLEALEIYQKRGHDISIVLLDLTMPRMSGGQCFRKLREINPDCKIVITSGYSLDTDGQILLENGAASFLAKPYNLDQLTSTVALAIHSLGAEA